MHASTAFLNGAASPQFRHRPQAMQRSIALLHVLRGAPAKVWVESGGEPTPDQVPEDDRTGDEPNPSGHTPS